MNTVMINKAFTVKDGKLLEKKSNGLYGWNRATNHVKDTDVATIGGIAGTSPKKAQMSLNHLFSLCRATDNETTVKNLLA